MGSWALTVLFLKARLHDLLAYYNGMQCSALFRECVRVKQFRHYLWLRGQTVWLTHWSLDMLLLSSYAAYVWYRHHTLILISYIEWNFRSPCNLVIATTFNICYTPSIIITSEFDRIKLVCIFSIPPWLISENWDTLN